MRKGIAHDQSSGRSVILREPVVVINEVASRAIGAEPAHYLSSREMARWTALSDDRRVEWLCGRVALKRAFLELRGTGSYRDLEVHYLAQGRPLIAGHEDVFCSISHSGGWSMGAASRSPIGVDIEAVRPRRVEMLSYIATASERRLLGTMARSSDDLLTMLWTVKEAVLKGLGVGLDIPPFRAEVTAIDGDGAVVELPDDVPACPRRWNVQTHRTGCFYHSVATPRGGSDR